MSNLKMDPTTNRVVLESNNLTIQGGVEAIAQDIQTRLLTVQGEWFLDTRIGIPYFYKIFGSKIRKSFVQTIFKKAIMSAPGVNSIGSFVLTGDGSTREYSLVFSADTIEGPLVYDRELII